MSDPQSLPDTDALLEALSWNNLVTPGDTTVLETAIAQHLSTWFGVDDYIVLTPLSTQSTYHALLSHPGSAYRASADIFSIENTFFLARLTTTPTFETLNNCGLSADCINRWRQTGITEVLGVLLDPSGSPMTALWIPLTKQTSLARLNTPLFRGVCMQIAHITALLLNLNTMAQQDQEIRQYRYELERMQAYLHGDIDIQQAGNEIIGSAPTMQKVLQRIAQVCFTNSTVLILGETGTGKELVAKAIHNQSPRHDKPMIRVNCAALPPNLIESELFGHEKGSFTGATDRRIGKFELADKGTLFLDEIGEMPPELQVKLLRALQEREIERVGGHVPIKTDVRVIAATNRVLEKEVQQGRFRKDLYYRLNVFPILLPPLRDRKEDIPALVAHFVTRFSQSNGKNITQTSRKALQALTAYSWPGNIRELEHLIERSVLMCTGHTLKHVALPQTGAHGNRTGVMSLPTHVKNFADNERDHILHALKACNGKVYGSGGAAELLGLKVSTLNSKILKLGIQKGKLFTRRGEQGQ